MGGLFDDGGGCCYGGGSYLKRDKPKEVTTYLDSILFS
jgi:hypothetical protein